MLRKNKLQDLNDLYTVAYSQPDSSHTSNLPRWSIKHKNSLHTRPEYGSNQAKQLPWQHAKGSNTYQLQNVILNQYGF
jgi:hypothetical protein